VITCICDGQLEVVPLASLDIHWQGVEQGGEAIIAGVVGGGTEQGTLQHTTVAAAIAHSHVRQSQR
jgi:hypothetical protein